MAKQPFQCWLLNVYPATALALNSIKDRLNVRFLKSCFRFEIISRKGPKIISGIQRSNGGRIEYDDDLPEETRISKGLKILLRPVLQELLETSGEGLEDLISFEQFHKKVEDIASRQVVQSFLLVCVNFDLKSFL